MAKTEEMIENWKQVHKVVLDFLDEIPEKSLHKKPFDRRFKTFAWEFSCIITTREMYIQGLKTRILNELTSCSKDEQIEQLSKGQLRQLISEISNELTKLIKNNDINEIDFWGKLTSKETVISWLLQHEQLHFGKLMLYLSQARLNLPNSLKEMWGQHSFSKKN